MRWFDWRAKQVARNHERSAIADLREGTWAKVVGRVTTVGTTIQSPIFGRTCAAYAVEAKDGGRHGALVEEVVLCELVVEDETGRAIIHRRDNVLLMLSDPREAKMGVFGGSSEPRAVEFFRRHNVTTSHYEYVREAVVEPSQRVVVFGMVQAPPSHDLYRAGLFGFSSTEQLLVTDDLACGD
jgi:hypothetical protein